MLRRGAACGGGSREGTMQFTCLLVSSAPSNEPSHKTGCFSHCGKRQSPQPALSQFPVQSAPSAQSATLLQPASPTQSESSLCTPPHQSACSGRFFLTSVVVGVPCSLIFWHFWLFIDFRLVVILLLAAQGEERFMPMPPSWPELTTYFYCLCKLEQVKHPQEPVSS